MGRGVFWRRIHAKGNKLVKVFTSPGCVQCTATYRKLDDEGVEYEVINLAEDAVALDYVKGLGYQKAPVVIADKENHWSGFRPDLIERLMK